MVLRPYQAVSTGNTSAASLTDDPDLEGSKGTARHAGLGGRRGFLGGGKAQENHKGECRQELHYEWEKIDKNPRGKRRLTEKGQMTALK